jgi:hypothetical protein
MAVCRLVLLAEASPWNCPPSPQTLLASQLTGSLAERSSSSVANFRTVSSMRNPQPMDRVLKETAVWVGSQRRTPVPVADSSSSFTLRTSPVAASTYQARET